MGKAPSGAISQDSAALRSWGNPRPGCAIALRTHQKRTKGATLQERTRLTYLRDF
ncbi:hypothetical protein [Nostoc sp.]|uniref:hypothetical protein n=1 Tax=Nostoc sp. TaxID=1180 RepID=UPI002FF989A8